MESLQYDAPGGRGVGDEQRLVRGFEERSDVAAGPLGVNVQKMRSQAAASRSGTSLERHPPSPRAMRAAVVRGHARDAAHFAARNR